MWIVHFAQIHLFCGDQLLGSCDVPVDVLTRQLPDNSYSQRLSISDYYAVSIEVDVFDVKTMAAVGSPDGHRR